MADKREIEYERQVVLGNFISRPIITWQDPELFIFITERMSMTINSE
jgi:hypothetical protein